MASSELDEYFAGKADTYEVFQAVAAQIVLRTSAEASSRWLKALLARAYQYGIAPKQKPGS